jgi:L-serine dehydratase
MAFISVCNDVLGPIMRGPSSSHTAGGYRIGVMVRGLLAEEPGSVRVTFDPEGSMAPTYRPLGVDLALTAGLMGWSMLDERYFEALDRAGDEGVTLDFQIAPLEHTDHPNGMLIETESVSGRRLRVVAEAVGGGGVRIVRIDDWPVDIDGKSSQVMVEIDAESGADVVSLLSDPNRQVAGGSVLLNARTDALEDDGAVAGIGKLSGVTNVWAVSPVFFVRKGETLFESAEEMVTMAEERGLSLGETALAYEVELLGMTELEAVDEMLRRYEVMEASIEAGLDDGRSDMLLLQPTAPQVFQAESAGAVAIGGIHTRAAARALAVMHCCNSRGVVCAAPTGWLFSPPRPLASSLPAERPLPPSWPGARWRSVSRAPWLRRRWSRRWAAPPVKPPTRRPSRSRTPWVRPATRWPAPARCPVTPATQWRPRAHVPAPTSSSAATPTLSHSMRPSTHRMRWARPCPASFGVLPREVALSLRQRSVFHAFARCPASAGCLHRVLGWIFLCRRVLQGPRQCGSHGG